MKAKKNAKQNAREGAAPEAVHVIAELYGGILQGMRIYRKADSARKAFKRLRSDMERRGRLHPDCGKWEAYDGEDEQIVLWEDMELR